MQKKQNNNFKKQNSSFKNYAKYSSIAFQMLFIILIGVFGGMKLDEYLNWDFPVFTVVFSILSVSENFRFSTFLRVMGFIFLISLKKKNHP